MRGITVQSNETAREPLSLEASVKSDEMNLEDSLIHLATCLQAIAQSLGNISIQLRNQKRETNVSNPVESIPNDK